MTSDSTAQKILNALPYRKPFLFVDKILEVNENSITGSYCFREDEAFYQGHFTGTPVTPGVILLEVMGQIGLVCLGIYLTKAWQAQQVLYPVLSWLESEFHTVVKPGETVFVKSEKIYFRNRILKCRIQLQNEKNETVVTTTAICTFISEIK